MEHICPLCNSELNVARTYLSVEGDSLPNVLTSTKVYNNLWMICVNPKCPNYAGADTTNPKTVVKTIKNEMPLG